MNVAGNKQTQVVDSDVSITPPKNTPEKKEKPVTIIPSKDRVQQETLKKGSIKATNINFFTPPPIAVDNTFVKKPVIFSPISSGSSTVKITKSIPKKESMLTQATNEIINETKSVTKTISKVISTIGYATVPAVFHNKKTTEADAGTYIDLASKEKGDYIFLFNTRSGVNINWETPTKLSLTTGLGGISKKLYGDASAIGHAQVGWVSNDGKGHITSGGAGQSGQHGGEGGTVAMKGWGLNVLNTVFLDGELEHQQGVLDRTAMADKQKSFSWVAIKTDHETLMKMANFVEEYDKSGAAKNYGFSVDPLKMEGAGCTSFANASFYKTGLDIPIFNGSVRKLNLPLEYMGKRTESVPKTRAPELASGKADEKKVSLVNMLVNNVKWASDSQPHQNFQFFDPELYYESAIEMENVVREKSHMEPKSFARTKKPDAAQEHAKDVSEKWIKSLIDQNVPIKIAKIHSTSGLVIDLTNQPKK